MTSPGEYGGSGLMQLSASNLDARFSQARATLQENLSKRFHVPELARSVGLSPRYLQSCFKKETGLTFVAFYRNLRMAQARAFLAETSQSIKAIALDLGYKRVEVFDREFRQFHSSTPTEYRASLQKRSAELQDLLMLDP